jgi:hypothetical protein
MSHVISVYTKLIHCRFESGLVAPFLYAAGKNGWIRTKTAGSLNLAARTFSEIHAILRIAAKVSSSSPGSPWRCCGRLLEKSRER